MPHILSNQWIAKRRPHWDRLAALLSQSDQNGLAQLSRSELQELALLYRQVAADLSVLREDATARTYAEHVENHVRQLQRMMERLTILAPGGRIDDVAVRQAIEQMDSREGASESLADTETEQIRRVLAATNGNKSRAAKILGIERKTLYRKLERMGL